MADVKCVVPLKLESDIDRKAVKEAIEWSRKGQEVELYWLRGQVVQQAKIFIEKKFAEATEIFKKETNDLLQ